jgi:hypothetical protein
MRFSRGLAVLAACTVVVLGGCNTKPKLNETKEYTLDETGSVQNIEVPPVDFDQTVNVEFDSGGTPVSVYLIVGKDAGAKAYKELQNNQKPTAAPKASAEKQSKGNLSAPVPAKELLTILIANTPGKSAAVKVKLTN